MTTTDQTPFIGKTDIDALGAIGVTNDIVSAYLGHNAMSRTDVPSFIAEVHAAVTALYSGAQPAANASDKTWPGKEPRDLTGREIKALVQPDYITSLEDGKRYKTIKRHLRLIGLTVEQYREKWDLPSDFPSTAPNYSAKRSELAKANGLGTKR